MEKESKIYVAGHAGLVGSAILKTLRKKGYTNFVLRTSKELDLTNQELTHQFFRQEKPEYVFLAAAYVGGIMANNTYRADFIYRNLMIQNNVIHAAYENGVKKLLFLGSTCIYPKEAPQPMKEDSLLTSPLEYTNEPYAIAKIAGMKMCESYNIQYGTNYISVMPTNLYGPNDNFDLVTSHVLPAMIRKIHLGKLLQGGDWKQIRADLAKRPVAGIDRDSSNEAIAKRLQDFGIFADRVALWGTGMPRRDFLWSEDMAGACVFVMEQIDFPALVPQGGEIRNTHINIGTGIDISIKELAYLVKEKTEYRGEILFDASKPDGTMKKLTDVEKLHALGWRHTVEIDRGIEQIYEWYKNNLN